MTAQTNKEQLSALMDGELEKDQCDFLIRKLNREASMQHAWHRYHMARACIQQEFEGSSSLVSRVRIALEQVEPDRVSIWSNSWLRTGVGGAMAACVALVAVVGLNTRLAPDSDAQLEAAPGFVSQGTSLDRQFSQQAVPVSLGDLPAGRSPVSASQIVSRPFEETRERIDRYLIQNNKTTESNANRAAAFSPVLIVPLQPGLSADQQTSETEQQGEASNQP